ncbi:MAG: hypothetical protein K2P80_03310 [Beijerinckiaceae bacterium]|nr:hypothetical protein [Beijerinckiaceae bacterium]
MLPSRITQPISGREATLLTVFAIAASIATVGAIEAFSIIHPAKAEAAEAGPYDEPETFELVF